MKKLQEDEFREQVNMEGDITKLENDQVAYKKTKLNEDLKEQIRQNEIRTKFDHEIEKKPVATSGGPVIPEREVIIKKYKNKQALTKLELERQMQMRQNEEQLQKQIEKHQEKKDSELIAAAFLEDKKMQQQKMKQ